MTMPRKMNNVLNMNCAKDLGEVKYTSCHFLIHASKTLKSNSITWSSLGPSKIACLDVRDHQKPREYFHFEEIVPGSKSLRQQLQ